MDAQAALIVSLASGNPAPRGRGTLRSSRPAARPARSRVPAIFVTWLDELPGPRNRRPDLPV